jgi:thymidylate synthase (FAD)
MNDEHRNISIDLYGDGIGKVQLIQHWGTDATIVRSARVSFGGDSNSEELSEKDAKLIRYLVKHKHTSTLEHCGATFKFIVPMFVRSQHHRHRTWSYNEISRRYTSVNLNFYEPEAFRTQHKSNRQASNAAEMINDISELEEWGGYLNDCHSSLSDIVKMHHGISMDLYNNLMEAGVCREQARGVLPQNLYTEYYGTVNLNNLIKFINLRLHEGAQFEIQKVAEACLEIATDLWPVSVGAYRGLREDA